MPAFISGLLSAARPHHFAATALAFFLLAAPIRVSAGDGAIREVVQLQANPRSTLNDVKVASFDTSTGKYRTEASALSDIWMRLSSGSGDIHEILSQPNIANAQDGLFTVELFSVVNGRLHSDSTGSCGGWSNNLSWCTYGCDGQGFEMKRVATDFPIRMNILVASKAPERKDGGGHLGRGPLPLTLCGADANGLELLVVPSKDKPTAEIELSAN